MYETWNALHDIHKTFDRLGLCMSFNKKQALSACEIVSFSANDVKCREQKLRPGELETGLGSLRHAPSRRRSPNGGHYAADVRAPIYNNIV